MQFPVPALRRLRRDSEPPKKDSIGWTRCAAGTSPLGLESRLELRRDGGAATRRLRECGRQRARGVRALRNLVRVSGRVCSVAGWRCCPALRFSVACTLTRTMLCKKKRVIVTGVCSSIILHRPSDGSKQRQECCRTRKARAQNPWIFPGG